MPNEGVLPPVHAHFELQPIAVASEGVAALDQISRDPYAVLERSFTDRFSEVLHTLGDELTERGQRFRRAAAFVTAGAMQAAERARTMVLILPEVFDETLEYSTEHGINAYATGGMAFVAVGGLYTAIGYTIGKTFKKAVDVFPATTAKVKENHPVMVDVVGDAISGFPSEAKLGKDYKPNDDGEYEVGPYDTKETLLGKLGLVVKRGNGTVYLFGTTPHAGVAEVRGHSDESIERRLRAVSVEGGVAVGGLAVALTALIANNFFGAAEEIKSTIENPWVWRIGSVLAITATAVINKLSRVKKEKERQTQ